MKLHRLVILLASAMAMVVVSMLGAVAAQAEENKGPLWIVGSPARGLQTNETRKITSRTETEEPKLVSAVATIVCEKATNEGFIAGGSPGTDYAKITFVKCHVEGKPNCTATGLKPIAAANEGEVVVEVLTVLTFAPPGRASALDLFAPEGEAANANLFVEFEIRNKAGTNECGLILNKTKPKVEAKGTEIKINGVTRKAGQLSKVGHANGLGEFVLSAAGETATVGLLVLPSANITKAAWFNAATAKYEEIEAKLEAGALGEVHEVAVSQIETVPAEAFGWNF